MCAFLNVRKFLSHVIQQRNKEAKKSLETDIKILKPPLTKYLQLGFGKFVLPILLEALHYTS